MYGLFMGAVALFCIAIGVAYQDPSAGMASGEPGSAMPADVEGQATSIAGSIQYAMADVAASCIMQPRGSSPAACNEPTAATGGLTTGSMQALATLSMYSAGTNLGSVATFVARDAAAVYVVSAYLPSSAQVAASYCGLVQRDLMRMTGNSNWVAPYDAATQSVRIEQSNQTDPSAPLAFQTVSLAGIALPNANGCPVMVDEVDQ